MPVHNAKFNQPGPVLNPLGVKLPGPIQVEVYFADKGHKWEAREASSGRPIKQAGKHSTPGSARYAVAKLFDEQVTPWDIDGTADPNADCWHIHIERHSPSMCGSRYHQREAGDDCVLILTELRTGIRRPPGGVKLCPVCVSTIDRTIQVGDAVRNTAGRDALVMGVVGKDEILVQWQDTGESGRADRGALTPLLSERLR
jgi:hypothetical protein